MKEYLKKLKIELAMEGYHDGWTLKWIKDKIKEIEEKIKLKKHKFKDD